MSNKNSFIKVEQFQQFDVVNQSYVEDKSVKVDVDAMLNGVVSKIGLAEFGVLMVIAAYSSVEGNASPSQRKLAELTGVSLPTINKIVNRLVTVEVNGVPVLSKEVEQAGSKKKYSVYKINAEKVENEKSDLEVGVQEVKPKNSKDFAMLFKKLYEEEYKIPYSINFRREVPLIKSKLVSCFDEEQICDLFEYIIKNYKSKWANTKYPYPTIPMICSWLGNTAMQLIKQEKDKSIEVKKLEELTSEYVEADYSDFDNI